ncbi:MAG: nucleotidyltransferase domain-containing protein [Actinomycetota bacterium]
MGTGPELIKRARRAAGLTQAELARRAGTVQSAIAAYESGSKTPTVDTLTRLLEAAGQQLGSSPVPSRSRGPHLARSIRAHRDSIIATAAAHGASNVRVFGSVARGRARPGSDVDLLVDMDHDASLLDQVRLRRALQELLGTEVDVVTSGSLLERDANILDEAVPL